MKTVIKFVEPPEKVADYEGKLVQSQRAVATAISELPAKTLYKITSSGIVKRLESFPCEGCGLKQFVSVKDKKEVFLREFKFVELVEEQLTPDDLTHYDKPFGSIL